MSGGAKAIPNLCWGDSRNAPDMVARCYRQCHGVHPPQPCCFIAQQAQPLQSDTRDEAGWQGWHISRWISSCINRNWYRPYFKSLHVASIGFYWIPLDSPPYRVQTFEYANCEPVCCRRRLNGSLNATQQDWDDIESGRWEVVAYLRYHWTYRLGYKKYTKLLFWLITVLSTRALQHRQVQNNDADANCAWLKMRILRLIID